MANVVPVQFIVMLRDNFHYMDEDDVVEAGRVDSYVEAVSHCRTIVQRSLAHHFRAGMTDDELFDA